MSDNEIDKSADKLLQFAKVFSNESFESIKGTVQEFLKLQGDSQNAVLEFSDKTVYLHQHKGDVEIHIVDGDRSEAPDLPQDED